jgi:hypothetical protein
MTPYDDIEAVGAMVLCAFMAVFAFFTVILYLGW